MIDWLMKQARHHSSSSSDRRSPTTKVQNSPPKPKKRKRLVMGHSSSAVAELTLRFPNRYAMPAELHTRSSIRHGTCVMCSAVYKDKKREGKKVKSFEEERKRTLLHCSYCTLTGFDNDVCFLCKEHFNEFHSLKHRK